MFTPKIINYIPDDIEDFTNSNNLLINFENILIYNISTNLILKVFKDNEKEFYKTINFIKDVKSTLLEDFIANVFLIIDSPNLKAIVQEKLFVIKISRKELDKLITIRNMSLLDLRDIHEKNVGYSYIQEKYKIFDFGNYFIKF